LALHGHFATVPTTTQQLTPSDAADFAVSRVELRKLG